MKKTRIAWHGDLAVDGRFTKDDAAGMAMIHTTEQLGPKRHLTPDGFLLCKDVPIGRTGTLTYGPGEVDVRPGEFGVAFVTRDEAELFNPITVGSFAGKPVTNDHPPGGVTTQNAKDVSVGTVYNPRRGPGADSDVLLGDLLITDDYTIRDIQAGKVEVSAGYIADYEDYGDGSGRQFNIVGNHVALVQRGRCGPRCAIGDQHHHQPPQEGTEEMPQTNTTARPRVTISPAKRKLILDAATEAMNSALDGEDGSEDPGNQVHIHMHTASPNAPTADADDDPVEKRFKAIEGEQKKTNDALASISEAVGKLVSGPGATTGDCNGGPANLTAATADAETDEEKAAREKKEAEAKKTVTADSAALETGFKAMLADAEVLVPGFRLPTFDAAAQRKVTVDAMCGTRRKVLDLAYATAAGKELIDATSGGDDVTKMSCDAVAVVFRAAAATQRVLNNTRQTADGGRMAAQPAGNGNPASPRKGPQTIADINKMNADFYAGRH